MKDKVYITIIALLTALTVFYFLSHKRDCRQMKACGMGILHKEQGDHGRGKGRRLCLGKELFSIIASGSNDTALLYEELEKIVDVQRQNQKRTLLKILTIRDSLTGSERDAFLSNLNVR
jgi:hypothetical protein